MIGFDLSEEQLSYQQFARAFAEKEMKPYAAELDQRQGPSFDWGIVRRFAKANLLGLNMPREYGGLGVDLLTAAVIAEELGAACLGITDSAGGTWLATTCLTLIGNEDQKRRYLPMICSKDGNLSQESGPLRRKEGITTC
jgi:alkylation response protein AidB-like acyl-CoA dehydrogenase